MVPGMDETEIKVKAEASHIRIKTELSGGIRVTSDPPEPALKNLSFLQTSLLVQWLRLCSACHAGSTGSVPGWKTKIPHDMSCGQRINIKKRV